MKKLLLIAIFLFLPFMVEASVEKATVINFETGDRKAVDVNDPHAFDGGYTLELALLSDREIEPIDDDMVGYTVVTDYKTTVNAPMSISQDYIPVSSLTTKDGHVLTIDDVGKSWFIIEQGRDKEEIVLCENNDTTTIRWTECTRGLAFYGKSLAAVQANRKTHSSGSQVIMSNAHYVYDQFMNKEDDQTLNGIKTFGDFPQIATSTALPTSDGEFSTKYYVDTVGAGGFTSLNVDTDLGLEAQGTAPETVGINASSTKALAFDSSGALMVVASSTSGLLYDTSGALYFDESKDYTLTGSTTMDWLEINDLIVTGLIKEYIATSSITGGTTPQAVYMNNADESIAPVDSSEGATSTREMIGLAISSGSAGETILVQVDGIVGGFSNLVRNTNYYVNDDLSIDDIQGFNEILVGKSVSDTQLFMIKEQYTTIASTSDNLRFSMDTERDGVQTSYTKKKEMRFGKTGTVRISFEVGGTIVNDGSTSAFGRIYIDGGAVGTERQVTRVGSGEIPYEEFFEDIDVVEGELLQLYGKVVNGANTYRVKNFRVYYDETSEFNSATGSEIITD